MESEPVWCEASPNRASCVCNASFVQRVRNPSNNRHVCCGVIDTESLTYIHNDTCRTLGWQPDTRQRAYMRWWTEIQDQYDLVSTTSTALNVCPSTETAVNVRANNGQLSVCVPTTEIDNIYDTVLGCMEDSELFTSEETRELSDGRLSYLDMNLPLIRRRTEPLCDPGTYSNCGTCPQNSTCNLNIGGCSPPTNGRIPGTPAGSVATSQGSSTYIIISAILLGLLVIAVIGLVIYSFYRGGKDLEGEDDDDDYEMRDNVVETIELEL